MKSDEQKMQSIPKWDTLPKYQFLYDFDDEEVIMDCCHLILTYLRHAYNGNAVDQPRLENFIKTFFATFFDIDSDIFQQRMSDIYDTTPPNEEVEDDPLGVDDQGIMRGRRVITGRKGTLLRGVLERQPGNSNLRDENGLPLSEDTTPDVFSVDEDIIASIETPTDAPVRPDSTEYRWMEHPTTGNTHNRQILNYNEPFKRDNYNLYATANIYCFFRMFQMLYERFVNLKANEKEVHEYMQRSKLPKAAHELRLIEKKPIDMWLDVGPDADYYHQVVRMCGDAVKNELDSSALDDYLRQFYTRNGWQLFNYEKMVGALLRFALQILVSDNKDKSLDIINLFYKDRKDSETTHQSELTYRKQVERLGRDCDLFRIRYVSTLVEAILFQNGTDGMQQAKSSHSVTLAIFKREDKTFEIDELAAEAKWSYYISSYTMRDLTEGIDLGKLNWPFLKRNMPLMLETEQEYNRVYTPQWNCDELIIRISPDNYHIQYESHTQEWFVHDVKVRRRGLSGMKEAREERNQNFRKLFGGAGTKWKKGLTKEEVESHNQDFSQLVKGSVQATKVEASPEMNESEVREDA